MASMNENRRIALAEKQLENEMKKRFGTSYMSASQSEKTVMASERESTKTGWERMQGLKTKPTDRIALYRRALQSRVGITAGAIFVDSNLMYDSDDDRPDWDEIRLATKMPRNQSCPNLTSRSVPIWDTRRSSGALKSSDSVDNVEAMNATALTTAPESADGTVPAPSLDMERAAAVSTVKALGVPGSPAIARPPGAKGAAPPTAVRFASRRMPAPDSLMAEKDVVEDDMAPVPGSLLAANGTPKGILRRQPSVRDGVSDKRLANYSSPALTQQIMAAMEPEDVTVPPWKGPRRRRVLSFPSLEVDVWQKTSLSADVI